MQATILAAGIGTRLRPITDERPKTLVEVNGQPILGYILSSLKQNGITDITICLGYKKERIISFCQTYFNDLNLRFVANDHYDSTNNMYSLYLAFKEMRPDDLLLMNADLVFEPEIIRRVLDESRTTVAVDRSTYNAESMKITVKNTIITGISKKISEEDAYGCSIDIYKINRADLEIIATEMKRIIEEQKEVNLWTEVMLNNLFNSGRLNAVPCDISGRKWYEIDDFQDLRNAERMFEKN